MTRKTAPPKKLLTDAELELMQALWDLSEGTVREVMDALPKQNQWAYTTVATVFKVLEKKGFVVSRKTERALTYFPQLTRGSYETKSVQHLVQRVFRGASSPFAMKLLSETKLSAEEIQSLRELLEKATS